VINFRRTTTEKGEDLNYNAADPSNLARYYPGLHFYGDDVYIVLMDGEVNENNFFNLKYYLDFKLT
jgi:hypothetical protein